MKFSFANIGFEVINGRIIITNVGNFATGIFRPFAQVQIAGENKISHMGVKMINSSEGEKHQLL